MTLCIKGPCPSGWRGWDDGKCLKYYSTPKTWHEALQSCQTCSSNPTSTLVSIPDSATNNFVTSLISGNAWIGGQSNSARRWSWLDGGTRWSYQNWWTGEPNDHAGIEDFLELYCAPGQNHHGRWNDQRGSDRRGYVCQLCKHLFRFA